MLPIINTFIINEHQITAQAYKNILISNQKDLKLRLNTYVLNDISSTIENFKKSSSLPEYHLLILDTNVTFNSTDKINSIEKLCLFIKQKSPQTKLIITTSSKNNLRLINLLTRVNPDGLLVKSDITNLDLSSAIRRLLSGNPYYSSSVLKLFRKKIAQNIILDSIDTEILKELSNGSKMMELLKIIPLTKSGIEKRKRRLKQIFHTKTNSDRELVLSAKEQGFL
ncbi:response regulator transcription factor [Algibacter mikhailovii]|uniref:Response regulator transcription factor n=1 Tax=Algibacter mikhailovii TaxID=425498 RepID=A0A918V7X5_9FLAO|nr:response regulator transcription factor [Algibacter mikhailovii]GGZ73910.1 hypothetical protein GCM10007028_09000 [Algibacter mikhailovii]